MISRDKPQDGVDKKPAAPSDRPSIHALLTAALARAMLFVATVKTIDVIDRAKTCVDNDEFEDAVEVVRRSAAVSKGADTAALQRCVRQMGAELKRFNTRKGKI